MRKGLGAMGKILGGITSLAVLVLIIVAIGGYLPTITGEGEPTTYTPWTLSHVYMYVFNNADKDSTFGADDVTCRVYDKKDATFLDPYLDSDGNAATTGQIDFDGARLKTGTTYWVRCYEGDGGTNLYATDPIELRIPKLPSDASSTSWTYDQNIYMDKEGAFTSVAWDSDTAAFDESSGVITLNKTAQTVQGCLKWDGTISDSVAGSILKDPVLIVREDPSTPLTDVNDVEHVYLTVKSGTGVEVPSGDLKDYFTGEVPIPLTSDGELDDSTSATITLTICFPASESDVGTGQIQIIVDDLGDYRAKDFDNDVRATADVTTIKIVS